MRTNNYYINKNFNERFSLKQKHFNKVAEDKLNNWSLGLSKGMTFLAGTIEGYNQLLVRLNEIKTLTDFIDFLIYEQQMKNWAEQQIEFNKNVNLPDLVIHEAHGIKQFCDFFEDLFVLKENKEIQF